MSSTPPSSVTMANVFPVPGNELKIKLSVGLLSLVDLPLPALPKTLPKAQAKIEPIYLDLEQTARGYKITGAKSAIKVVPKRNRSSSDGHSYTESEEKTYRCRIAGCGKVFSDSGSLRKHAMTHGERQFICPIPGCSKKFLDNSKLRRHMLVHTGEKPFMCEFCHKNFSLDFNLRTHLRTHTGEKPYQCSVPGCFKRFTQSSNLTAHEKTHTIHPPADRKPTRVPSYPLPTPLFPKEPAFLLDRAQDTYEFMAAQPAYPDIKEESALP